ncbi:MAG: hypothetical protein DMG32_23930 [Acidobacteria bacterium]|nr:MAG: hypothetical protein DMG32_23930 [Acidobacteriota bacterium]
MDSLEARPMPGTEGAMSPFFSPDSQWVGFFQSGTLKKVSISGGAAVSVGYAANPRGASWDGQRAIIFAPSQDGPLLQVSNEGEVSRPLTQLEKADITHRWPDVLAGGKAIAFVAASRDTSVASARILVRSIQTGEQRDLGQGITYPRYVPSGHLIYAQGTTLMAVPFDPDRLEIKGSAIPMVEGVAVSQISGAAQYGISSTGSLVYVSGVATAVQRKLVWVNRNGTEQALPAPAQAYRYARLSPDGLRVAVESDSQIWIYDLNRDTFTRLTFEGTNQGPVWTPDGKRITVDSSKEGTANLFWQLADGSGGLERLGTSQYAQVPRS